MKERISKNKGLVAGILFAALILLSAFIPMAGKDQILIKAPLNNILLAVQDLSKWKNWHPDLLSSSPEPVAAADQQQYRAKNLQVKILSKSPFGILVNENQNGKEKVYSLLVIPSDDPGISAVQIAYKTTLLKGMLEQITSLFSGKPDPQLAALRSYLTEPKRYYGYEMAFITVTDTLVATTLSKASQGAVTDSLKQMFARLHDFTERNRLTVTDKPIAYIQRNTRGESNLMAGLPVSRETEPQGSIRFQKMPLGRMLIVEFSGDYRNIQKAYTAADRYINDYGLKTVALPYERYLTNAVTATDSTRMKIRLYFPIL